MPNGQHDPSPAEIAGDGFPELRREVVALRGQVEKLEQRTAYLEERLREKRMDSLALQAKAP